MPWTRNGALSPCVLLAVSLVSLHLSSQNATSQNESNAEQARGVLISALTAMGGSSAWSGVADATVTGSCSPLNSERPANATPIRWVISGDQFRYENGSPTESNVMLSGHGKPSMASPSGSDPLTSETAELQKPFHLPGLVFSRILSDQRYRIQIVQDAGSESSAHIHISRYQFGIQQPGSQQDWWIDRASLVPLKVRFKIPGQAVESYMDMTYTFSGWNKISGVTVPQQLVAMNEFGTGTETCAISGMQINTQPAPSLFDAR
jgi:hypothetical protein